MIDITHLPNQERGEKTVLFLRRHWIQVVEIIGLFFLLLLVPVLVLLFLGASFLQQDFWGPVVSVGLSAYLFLVLIITMTQITDYYLDTWIVSTERIINIEQKGLFSRVVSELHLNQVQDVTSETHGLVQTFLSYGDVYIQTAGTRERFNFKTVDNPDEVKRVITRLVNDDKRRHGDASQPGVATEASAK